MESKENKSNMFFCPDGSENRNNNSNSDEMANFIKVFGDPAHRDSRFSEASYYEKSSDNYNVLYDSSEKKKRRKKHKHYSNKKISRAALKISVVSLSVSISTLVALAIEKIKK